MPRTLAALGALAVLLASLAGCTTQEEYFHRFHGPTDVAYLDPGVFEVPVGYVANFRSGQIAKLDLKRIDLLVEEGVASWYGAPYLACGHDRVLDQIAVLSDGATRIDVYVSDNQRNQVLRVPHVIPDGEGGFTFAEVTWTGPTLYGPDGAALSDGPVLGDLEVRPGYATTETWTLTYRDHSWHAVGTRSGAQLKEAVPGMPYETDGDELAFTVYHGGEDVEDGTYFTLTTDTGIVEYDAPGIVTDLKTAPGVDAVFATVLGYDGRGLLWVLRGDGDFAEIPLPAGTVPENMALHRDGRALFIADSSPASRVLRVDFDDEAMAFTITELPVSEPSFDVAHSGDPDHDYLFVAAAYGETVEIVDLATGEPVDVNPWTEEVDPVFVGSLITGLDATHGTLDLNTVTDIEEFEERFAIVATTYAGYMHVIEADTGCQALETSYGPYLELIDVGSEVQYYDVGPENDVFLLEDPVTLTPVSINPCGGVARDQVWTVRFDEAAGNWEVEGDISGVQLGRAREDQRYVSDDGEISFVIASGARAPSDGDWLRFSVNDGVSPIGVLELPADPLVFTDVFDFREGAWWEHRERQVAIVANAGNDVVMWVHIEGYGGGGLKYFR